MMDARDWTDCGADSGAGTGGQMRRAGNVRTGRSALRCCTMNVAADRTESPS